MGGKVIASGTPDEIERSKESLTGAYLSGRKRIEPPEARRKPRGAIVVRGAGESQLIELMNATLARFPGMKVFSLPHMSETDRYIELGVRGEAQRVPAAIAALKSGVIGLGFTWADAP